MPQTTTNTPTQLWLVEGYYQTSDDVENVANVCANRAVAETVLREMAQQELAWQDWENILTLRQPLPDTIWLDTWGNEVPLTAQDVRWELTYTGTKFALVDLWSVYVCDLNAVPVHIIAEEEV